MQVNTWCGRAGTMAGALMLLLLLLSHRSHAGPVAKRNIDNVMDGKDKRPFCNAFTGCGRKRSDPSVESAASGSELDDLAKHVLAEAKLWEELQTKVNKMEMMRTLAARMEGHPLYRRKRSPVHHSDSSARPQSTPTHTIGDLKEER